MGASALPSTLSAAMRLLQVLLLVAIASGLAVGVHLLARGGSRGGNAAGAGTSAEALTGGRAVADDERVARIERTG